MPSPVSTDSPLSASCSGRPLGTADGGSPCGRDRLAALIAGGTGQSGTVPISGGDAKRRPENGTAPFWLPRLPPQDARESPGQTLAEATARFQAEYIGRTIEQSAGQHESCGRPLGLNRSNLYRKMRQLGMDSPEGG